MKRKKVGTSRLDSFMVDDFPVLDGLANPIKNDGELQVRMALIDELYSHAKTPKIMLRHDLRSLWQIGFTSTKMKWF